MVRTDVQPDHIPEFLVLLTFPVGEPDDLVVSLANEQVRIPPVDGFVDPVGWVSVLDALLDDSLLRMTG